MMSNARSMLTTLALVWSALLTGCGAGVAPIDGDGDGDGLDGGSDGDGGDAVPEPAPESWFLRASEAPLALTATSEGDLVVAGIVDGRAWVARLDRGGAVRWQAAFSENVSYVDAMVELAGGDIVVVGEYASAGPGYDRNVIIRLSGDGRVLSEQSLSHGMNQSVSSAAPTAEGGLLLGGMVDQDLPPVREGFVIRFDSDLRLLWQDSLPDPVTALVETNTEDIVAFGAAEEEGTVITWLALESDPTGGWTIDGVEVHAAVQRDDGGFFLGGSASAEDGVMWLAGIDNATMSLEWELTLGALEAWTESDVGFGRLSAGGLAAAGIFQRPGGGEGDPWMTGVTSSGEVRWQRIIDGGSSARLAGLTTIAEGFAAAGVGERGGWVLRAAGRGDEVLPSCDRWVIGEAPHHASWWETPLPSFEPSVGSATFSPSSEETSSHPSEVSFEALCTE